MLGFITVLGSTVLPDTSKLHLIVGSICTAFHPKKPKCSKTKLKFCNTCWRTSCKVCPAAIKAAFDKSGSFITPPAVGAQVVPPGFLARSSHLKWWRFCLKTLPFPPPQQAILCSVLLHAASGAGNKRKATTLVASSLDVATYRPPSLPNHTIMSKLKKDREREGEQRKAGMRGGWELGDRKAAGAGKHRQLRMERRAGAALPNPCRGEKCQLRFNWVSN